MARTPLKSNILCLHGSKEAHSNGAVIFYFKHAPLDYNINGIYFLKLGNKCMSFRVFFVIVELASVLKMKSQRVTPTQRTADRPPFQALLVQHILTAFGFQ